MMMIQRRSSITTAVIAIIVSTVFYFFLSSSSALSSSSLSYSHKKLWMPYYYGCGHCVGLTAITTTTGKEKASSSSLFMQESSRNDEDVNDFEKERMNFVRLLQRAYYRSSSSSDSSITSTNNYYDAPDEQQLSSEDRMIETRTLQRPSLDPMTGKVLNVPLWRVGWVETPGRRNCLNVHEMQYTHMFEKLLSSYPPPTSSSSLLSKHPLYFGHLYLPNRSDEERYRLKTWHEELRDESRFSNYMKSSTTRNNPEISTPIIDRSAVIGCLMQVLDYRRMEDGRLMILVQALERFVVDEVVETLPYAVANVQILLDREELPWGNQSGGMNTNNSIATSKSRSTTHYDECICKFQRGKAVDASFAYHTYEFDRPQLPIQCTKNKNCDDIEHYLTKEDVPWVKISQLLPFAHYSTEDELSLDVANEKMTTCIHDADSVFAPNRIEDKISGEEILSIEQQLWNGGILWEPPSLPPSATIRSREEKASLSCDTIEVLLWLALDDFCRATGFVLPAEVRCLLPPELDYLDIQRSEIRLSSKYPKLRRQKRLSYIAPELIENIELPMKGMRQVWLNTPSTAERLLGALERYEYLNNKLIGEFE